MRGMHKASPHQNEGDPCNSKGRFMSIMAAWVMDLWEQTQNLRNSEAALCLSVMSQSLCLEDGVLLRPGLHLSEEEAHWLMECRALKGTMSACLAAQSPLRLLLWHPPMRRYRSVCFFFSPVVERAATVQRVHDRSRPHYPGATKPANLGKRRHSFFPENLCFYTPSVKNVVSQCKTWFHVLRTVINSVQSQ